VVGPDSGGLSGARVKAKGECVTLVWFVVWLVWNLVGDREPLLLDPVNFWAGALLFAIALDLGGHHATSTRR
jgi:hypothetical protein